MQASVVLSEIQSKIKMGMIDTTKLKFTAKPAFALTRKNQKGQVAIFVALIFQVLFVFFAVLINVGLLVHHKINLQHSTDLAAYYGAMKQAENMNAIAHVNFQIRQAWKLLTWRYRVLGTFGFRSPPGPGPVQLYPFDHVGVPGAFVYNGSRGQPNPSPNPGGMGCLNLQYLGSPLGIQDIPFFCVGHSGFASWSQSESMCQLDCNGFTGARVIGAIPLAGTAVTPHGGNVAGAVNAAITAVNNNISQLCGLLGPTGATVLTGFIAGYINETYPRIKTIEALAANLSLDADKILDIEGNTILRGAEATLKNNLTEANLTGFIGSSFRTENGLANNTCRFRDGRSGTEFLKKIEIEFINYFIHNCTFSGGAAFLPQNVYNPAGGLGSAFAGISAQERAILESLIIPGQQHTVGYEKNPYCIEYYGVKASSEPQIPFLPLTKIKLNAMAIAKPFGGSIGPWYGKTWPRGSPESTYDDNNQGTKTDETLPIRKLSLIGAQQIATSVFTQPNFSLFVGDRMGVRDLDYVAAYHSALRIRDIANYPGKNYSGSRNTTNLNQNAGTWPDFSNWDGLRNATIGDFRDYDALATNDPNRAGTRALEISAIAPNQFDITHYSIEPDFYNNYYKKLFLTGFQRILTATNSGGITVTQLRSDLGAVGMRADQPDGPPLTERTFSVKDQIAVKNIVLDVNPSTVNGLGYPGKTYGKVLNFLVSLQSSLLTSWTFLSFSNYTTFPGGLVDDAANTMSFGQCKDRWNNTVSAIGSPNSLDNFRTPMDQDANLPPTPGNCVTGGRTGYSVKLISPNQVRDNSKLENPINPSFFSF